MGHARHSRPHFLLTCVRFLREMDLPMGPRNHTKSSKVRKNVPLEGLGNRILETLENVRNTTTSFWGKSGWDPHGSTFFTSATNHLNESKMSPKVDIWDTLGPINLPKVAKTRFFCIAYFYLYFKTLFFHIFSENHIKMAGGLSLIYYPYLPLSDSLPLFSP